MKTGFIGCGNMGGAMIKGILDSGICAPEDIMASDRSKELLETKKNSLSIRVSEDNKETARFADILFLVSDPAEPVVDLQAGGAFLSVDENDRFHLASRSLRKVLRLSIWIWTASGAGPP